MVCGCRFKKRREERGRQREGARRSPDRNNQGVCGARMRCFKSGLFVERRRKDAWTAGRKRPPVQRRRGEPPFAVLRMEGLKEKEAGSA